jgi:sugar/nucleoside kinase (ribokinase family)
VYKVDTVDTTGAGDIYSAGFLYGLCTGRGLEECGHIASILAAGIVSRRGAQFSSEKIRELIPDLEK